jgi:hypothetical protein
MAHNWILRPSRSTSLSRVNGATGTGRIRSMVTRAMRIGTAVGIASAAQTAKAAGAEPCCILASQGPAAFGLVGDAMALNAIDGVHSAAFLQRLSRSDFCAGVYLVPNMRSPASPRPGTM